MIDLTHDIRAIAAHDHAAFNRLYRAESRRLIALATGLLAGDRIAAEDVVDATFVAVWQGAGGFRGEGPAEAHAWLRRILRNKAVDWLRIDGRWELGLDDQSDRVDPAADPETAAIHADAAARLSAALTRLTFDQREAVMLCYLEELSIADIAAIAGCPAGTVKTRLYHARLKLRRDLEVAEDAA